MLPGLNQPKASPCKKNLHKWLQMKAVPSAFPVEDQVASPEGAGSLCHPVESRPSLLGWDGFNHPCLVLCCFLDLCGVCSTSQFSILPPLMNGLVVHSPPTSSLLETLREAGPSPSRGMTANHLPPTCNVIIYHNPLFTALFPASSACAELISQPTCSSPPAPQSLALSCCTLTSGIASVRWEWNLVRSKGFDKRG